MHENIPIANQSQNSSTAAVSEAAQIQEPFAFEQMMAQKLPVQLKLSVGAVNDPLEHEADAMADKVMRMPETSFIQRKAAAHDPGDYDDEHVLLKPQTNGATSFIQRCSCTPQDDEHVRLKPLANQITPFIQAKSDGEVNVSDAVSGRIKSSMGGGSPMQSDTRSFMESRFGTDFSNVKIHNGDESIQLSRELNAKAFTVSNNVYFNSGQYQPQTDAGKHLLAHELTHVVQQSSSSGNIQRQVAPTPGEFDITGVSNDPNLRKVFFEKDSSAIDPIGAFKIGLLAGPPIPLSGIIELKGFTSEEEPASLASDRIDAVKKQFKTSKIFKGSFKDTPVPTGGKGRIAYRQARSVEIVDAGKKSTTPDCKTTPPKIPCSPTTESNFQKAVVGATKDITTATGLLNATARSAATNTLLDRFFGQGVAGKGALVLPTLLTNIALIQAQILRVKSTAHHPCANECDGLCGSNAIAYNTDVGNAATYTICPAFDTMDEPNRFRNMIHECAHGTAKITNATTGTDDFAYRHERLINLLDPTVALTNSDSYSLLIMFLADPAFSTQKPAVDDTSAVNKAAEKAQIGLPIANLEKWLSFAEQETAGLYDVMKKGPSNKVWTNSYYLEAMTIWASNFKSLTSTPALPNNNDQIIIAGIHDRVNTLARGVKKDLVFSRPPEKTTLWEFSGKDFGKNLKLGDDFFAAKDDLSKTMILLRAIVHSNMKIPLSSEPGYVDSIDRLRKRH